MHSFFTHSHIHEITRTYTLLQGMMRRDSFRAVLAELIGAGPTEAGDVLEEVRAIITTLVNRAPDNDGWKTVLSDGTDAPNGWEAFFYGTGDHVIALQDTNLRSDTSVLKVAHECSCSWNQDLHHQRGDRVSPAPHFIVIDTSAVSEATAQRLLFTEDTIDSTGTRYTPIYMCVYFARDEHYTCHFRNPSTDDWYVYDCMNILGAAFKADAPTTIAESVLIVFQKCNE